MKLTEQQRKRVKELKKKFNKNLNNGNLNGLIGFYLAFSLVINFKGFNFLFFLYVFIILLNLYYAFKSPKSRSKK